MIARTTRRPLSFILLAALIIGLLPGMSLAASVAPELWTGNQDPSYPGCTALKIEGNLTSGTYTRGGVTFTLTVYPEGTTGQTFDWTASAPISKVFVKGGNVGNLYSYNPAVTSDTGLHAPLNLGSGKYYGLSHVTFYICGPTLGSITVNKTDHTTGASLAGATFELRLGTTLLDTQTLTGSTYTWTGLSAGAYTVTETVAPLGYQLANPASQTITLSETNGMVGSATFTFANPQIPGSVTVYKKDADGTNGLLGATFRLTGPGGYDNQQHLAATDSYTWTNLIHGVYTLTEVAPPPGYSLASPASVTITVGPGNIDVSYTYKNTPVPGSITVRKFKMDGTTGLSGATFRLSQGAAIIDTVTLTTPTHTWSNLAHGTYTVTELTPPPGHQLADPVSQDVTVGPMTLTVTVDFRNPDATPGSITVRKFNATGTIGLTGATFQLRQGDKDGTLLDTQTLTGSTYTWTNRAAGTYTVVETIAPAGYELADPNWQTVTLSESGGMVGTATFEFRNTPKPGSITVRKFNDAGTTGLTGATFRLSQGATVIGTVTMTSPTYKWEGLTHGTYTVTEVSPPPGYQLASPVSRTVTVGPVELDVTVSYYNPPVVVPGSITVRKFEATGTTGLAGATFQLWQGTMLIDTQTLLGNTYTWSGLSAGTYTVVETVAPPGYQIADPDRQTITLSITGGMVGSATFDFKNTPVIIPGSITVRKFEATGTIGLTGATFELRLGTNLLDTQTLTGTTYTWTGLAAGTYTVTETVAPPGYQLANPASQTITLSETGGMVGSATFDFQNTPILGNLRVIKFLRDDDVITGLAGATFALYKPDMNGIKIDERVLETDEYTWTDLEPGAYTVVEVAAPPRPGADQQFELADPITVQVPGGATVTVEVYNELPRTGLEYGGHLISGLSMILLGLGVRRRLL